MKLVILCCLAAAALAHPQGYAAPPRYDGGSGSQESAEIITDDRVHPDAYGKYSFDVETTNGIRRSESGSPASNGASGQIGQVAFTFPNGEDFELSFVANENGYQPQSPFLPVAPAFPHPIPDFVLEQIEFARNNPIESRETYG
ncbi:unnamed protein product [Meganyctiphanes norvegica]|uniref:Uncharacterized protein n=1 Tax=Meganyctiphanes norvegica TaxID=48144 RepID=A0AAV2PLY9_MEGNR